MKIVMLAALIGLAASSTAFAQTSTGSTAQQGSANTSFTTASVTDQAGQWVAPYGQPVPERTRAQVYQRLVQAKQDGQLSYLDSTLYAHH